MKNRNLIIIICCSILLTWASEISLGDKIWFAFISTISFSVERCHLLLINVNYLMKYQLLNDMLFYVNANVWCRCIVSVCVFCMQKYYFHFRCKITCIRAWNLLKDWISMIIVLFPNITSTSIVHMVGLWKSNSILWRLYFLNYFFLLSWFYLILRISVRNFNWRLILMTTLFTYDV